MITEENIKSITCGILFNPSFKLLDYWGEIADDILYNSEQFPEKFFTDIGSNYANEHIIRNEETEDYIKINQNNIIFRQKINNKFDKEYELFHDRVVHCLVPNIVSDYNLVVRRIGIVYICKLSEQEIRDFSSLYFKPEIKNILDFRFSKKYPARTSIWHGKEDFINKIITVGSITDKINGVSYDYQHHFIPPQADIRDVINKVFEQGKTAFSKDVVSGINGAGE